MFISSVKPRYIIAACIITMMLFALSKQSFTKISTSENITEGNSAESTATEEVVASSSQTSQNSSQSTMNAQDEFADCLLIDDFSKKTTNWLTVNDNVMGGRSIGAYTISDQILTFSGAINTNGGGFSSIRLPLPVGKLEGYASIVLITKSDGRKYKLTLREQNQRQTSYQAEIPLNKSKDWQKTTIPFSKLYPSFFGRRTNADTFNPLNADEIGFIISDGIDGEFMIKINSMYACK